MSQIDMYFRFEDGKEFRIPVIPSEIQINDGSTWHRIEVLGLGEVATPAFRNPQVITFSSFFPYRYDQGYCQYPNLMHPNDASNLFNVAMGTDQSKGGKRPQIVRFIMVEEYERGLWTTWVDDDFAIDSFTKAHRAGDLVDQNYQISIRTARVPMLEATGALADNIGTQKPHPAIVRTGDDLTKVTLGNGDTPATISRPRISPRNAQLSSGIDISNVSNKLDATSFVDPTTVVGGSKFSAPDVTAKKWGDDSTDKVTMWEGDLVIGLGNFLDDTDYRNKREQDQNNGGTVIISTGGGKIW